MQGRQAACCESRSTTPARYEAGRQRLGCTTSRTPAHRTAHRPLQRASCVGGRRLACEAHVRALTPRRAPGAIQPRRCGGDRCRRERELSGLCVLCSPVLTGVWCRSPERPRCGCPSRSSSFPTRRRDREREDVDGLVMVDGSGRGAARRSESGGPAGDARRNPGCGTASMAAPSSRAVPEPYRARQFDLRSRLAACAAFGRRRKRCASGRGRPSSCCTTRSSCTTTSPTVQPAAPGPPDTLHARLRRGLAVNAG